MSLPDRKCPDCNGYGRFMFNKACETCNATGTMTDAGYIAALSARVAKLEAALTCAAVPLEVLAATECDDAGKALAPTTKAAVLRGRDAIRAALGDKS